MNFQGKQQKNVTVTGFTLVEMMVVVLIIALMVGIAVPIISRAIEGGRRAQAMTEINSIVRAIQAYHVEYGRYPHPPGSENGTYLDGNALLMNVLRAVPGPGNNSPAHRSNPKRHSFIEAQVDQLSDDGDYLDPWDQPYRVMIDLTRVGTLSVAELGETVERRPVVAWSPGANPNDQTRALKSW